MTTLTSRPRTALLVIDVQNGVVGEAHERDRVVANIAVLIDKARAEQVPVVWVAHSDEGGMPRGSQAWQYVDELRRDGSEPLVHKTFADSFEDTDLEAVLAGLEVGRLVVTGAQTDECIRSTLHGAITRGYDATLVADAHTTEGSYDVASGSLLGKHYVATDHLEDPLFARLTPDDLLDVAEEHGLGWDPETGTGIAFHMASAIAVAGVVGVTSIGNSPAEADALYDGAKRALRHAAS